MMRTTVKDPKSGKARVVSTELEDVDEWMTCIDGHYLERAADEAGAKENHDRAVDQVRRGL